MQSLNTQNLLEQAKQAFVQFTSKDTEAVKPNAAIAQIWATVSGPTAIALYKLLAKSFVFLLSMLVYLLGALFWLLAILLLTAATALNQQVNGTEGLPQFPLSESDADAIASVRTTAQPLLQKAETVRGNVAAFIDGYRRQEKSTSPAVGEVLLEPSPSKLVTVLKDEVSARTSRNVA